MCAHSGYAGVDDSGYAGRGVRVRYWWLGLGYAGRGVRVRYFSNQALYPWVYDSQAETVYIPYVPSRGVAAPSYSNTISVVPKSSISSARGTIPSPNLSRRSCSIARCSGTVASRAAGNTGSSSVP